MPKIIFDIETVGENWKTMDKKTQEIIKQRVIKVVGDVKNKKAIKEALLAEIETFSHSPLTGQIISIGMLDIDTKKGAVYFQSPDVEIEDFEEDGIKYKLMTEKEIIEGFWQIAKHADEFISFNGRSFDIPHILIRGAVHSIRPSKDLMASRYINMQKTGSKHIDLLDQLTFYGSISNNEGDSHMWTRAFGIKDVKEKDIDSEDVVKMFADKKYLEIAQYNASNLHLTRELFEHWEKYLRF